MTWSETLVDPLMAIGFDARSGVGPLQRAIEREAVTPLARWLLSNTLREGRNDLS